ncbi:hypothetical protein DQ04_04261070, partial [Trypanosoma grayi]|uniref:hypothetical protein n=1 Tax=Trypanosoma grayi TaxID=71804 RepID=UPI0004F416BA
MTSKYRRLLQQVSEEKGENEPKQQQQEQVDVPPHKDARYAGEKDDITLDAFQEEEEGRRAAVVVGGRREIKSSRSVVTNAASTGNSGGGSSSSCSSGNVGDNAAAGPRSRFGKGCQGDTDIDHVSSSHRGRGAAVEGNDGDGGKVEAVGEKHGAEEQDHADDDDIKDAGVVEGEEEEEDDADNEDDAVVAHGPRLYSCDACPHSVFTTHAALLAHAEERHA